MSENTRIKEVRTCLGLTQSKFSSRMAISPSYLGELESGAKHINERIARLLAAEFNVDEHWLRTGEGSMFNDDMDAYVTRMASLLSSLSQPFKSCALKQLEVLADLYIDMERQAADV